MTEQINTLKSMYEDLNDLIQHKTVLSKAASIIGGSKLTGDKSMSLDLSRDSEGMNESLVDAAGIAIGHIAGTILKEEQERFNRLVFRATRGNAIVYFREFTKPIVDYAAYTSGSQDGPKGVMKSVYIIVFQDGEFIRDRLIKLCDSFMGKR